MTGESVYFIQIEHPKGTKIVFSFSVRLASFSLSLPVSYKKTLRSRYFGVDHLRHLTKVRYTE